MEINKVSIIVPCYNQAQYLTEAVESVLKQTYQNWECIIVNDGSPDNTEEIALKLCSVDSRIKYYAKQNGGLADARNFGIKNSIGEYILPLDSDDKIEKTYIEKAVKVLNRDSSVQLVYSNAEFFGGKVGRWKLPDYSYEQLLIYNVVFCSAIFRRSRYDQTNGYNQNMIYGSEDWDFWLSLLGVQDEVVKLPGVHFFYRQKDTSMLVELRQDIDKMKKMRNQVYLNHKSIYDKYIYDNGGLLLILEQYYLIKKSTFLQKLFKIGKLLLRVKMCFILKKENLNVKKIEK